MSTQISRNGRRDQGVGPVDQETDHKQNAQIGCDTLGPILLVDEQLNREIGSLMMGFN